MLYGSTPESGFRYYANFADRFKGGGVVEIVPLYWFTDHNAAPKFAAVVVNSTSTPRTGETVVMEVGRDLRALDKDRHAAMEEELSRRIGIAQRNNNTDMEKELLDQSLQPDLGYFSW